jgi:multidrug efflux pump subunit AcrA (membrane-fusion protein)
MAFPLRKTAVTFVLIVIPISAAALVTWWLYQTRPSAQRSDVSPLLPMVSVHRVAAEDIPEVFVGYGSARADLEVTLTAEVNGVIVEVAEGLDEGTEVEHQQRLLRVDDREYRQQLARAESLAAEVEARIDQLDVEKANTEKLLAIAQQEVGVNREELDRLKDLFELNRASKREVDFARLDYQRSRREAQNYANQIALIEPRRKSLEATRSSHLADAERARLLIEKCHVTAPFAGHVERMSVNIGDRVMPGTELLQLVDTSVVEIPIELPASARPRVEVGAECRLDVESLSSVTWRGHVSRISPVADPRSRTFSAYIEVDNTEQETPLVPGYFVTARVAGPVLTQVLAVPRGAVLDGHVYVANDNVAHTRAVRVDRYIGDRAVVRGELKPGDRVIVTNLDTLSDGTTVRIETAEASRSDDAGTPTKSDLVLSGSEP